jgi:uncharacterized protein YjhX (UPF0386 family)
LLLLIVFNKLAATQLIHASQGDPMRLTPNITKSMDASWLAILAAIALAY